MSQLFITELLEDLLATVRHVWGVTRQMGEDPSVTDRGPEVAETQAVTFSCHIPRFRPFPPAVWLRAARPEPFASVPSLRARVWGPGLRHSESPSEHLPGLKPRGLPAPTVPAAPAWGLTGSKRPPERGVGGTRSTRDSPSLGPAGERTPSGFRRDGSCLSEGALLAQGVSAAQRCHQAVHRASASGAPALPYF